MAFNISYVYIAKDRFSAVARRINNVAKKLNSRLISLAIQAKKAGKAFNKIGKAVSLRLSAPVAIAGGIALKTAANMETLRVSLEVMLKSAEKGKKAFQELAEFTAKTPFQLAEVASSARRLLAAGVDIEMLNLRLTTLGNIASGANVPLQDLASIFSKIKSKNKAMTEEILQLSDRGIPIIRQLAESFKIPETAVFDLAAAGKITFPVIIKAFEDMTTGAGIFAGAMERQSKTISGSISTLKDNISLVIGATGEWFSKTIGLTDAIANLNNNINPVKVQEWFEEFSEGSPILSKVVAGTVLFATALGPVIFGLGQAIFSIGLTAQGITILSAAFPGLITRIKSTVVGFFSLIKAIGLTIISMVRLAARAAIFVVVKTAILAWTAAQWLLNAALTANPIGLIIVGIAALIAGVIFLVKKMGGMTALIDVFKKVGNGIIDFLVFPLRSVLQAVDAIAGTNLAAKLDSIVAGIKFDIEPPSGAAIAGVIQKTETEVNINLNAPPGIIQSVESRTKGEARTNVGQNLVMAGAG